MALPATYTVYRWEEAMGPLVKAEVPWSDPKEGQVIVKVLACGVCATDSLVQVGAVGGRFPAVPGHEVVGDIVAVHPSVKNFEVGQRVGAGWQQGSCGTCHNCSAGKNMGCDSLSKFTTGNATDGGIAQYITVATTGICPISNDLDPAETAPLLCAGLTVYKAMTYVTVPKGSLVAVHGIGGLGHLAIQYSKAMGYRTVAISSSSAKKDLSLNLGADYYIDESTQDAVKELTKLGGANMIVSTAPKSAGVWKMLGGLAFEGKLVAVSLPMDNAPLSPVALNGKRLSIHGYLVGDANDCAETVEFSRKHGIKSLVQRFPLDKAEEAYAHRAKAQFRAVVLPWA